MAVSSMEVLKEPADEAPSGGDNTRNPILQSVRKLREFWSRWQRRESRVLTGSANASRTVKQEGRPSSRASAPMLEVPPAWRSGRSRILPEKKPRYRRLREIARKVSSKFSSTNADSELCVGNATDSFDSIHDRALRPSGTGNFSELSSCSVAESTASAYAEVSHEIAHRLQSHTRPQDRYTVFPSNLFRRSSLELSRISYRKLKDSTMGDEMEGSEY